MCGADAIEVGDGQLSLIGTSLAKDNVARLEDDLGGLNVACFTPAPKLQ